MREPILDLEGVSPGVRASVRDGREAERRGRPSEARRHFELAVTRLESGHARLAATLFRWIAWNFANSGDSEAALDCLEVAEAVSVADGDDRGVASVLNTRAGTLFNLGDLDEAKSLFERVCGLAQRIDDVKLRAMADQNLGSVASIRGDQQEALHRFQSSLRGYRELGEHRYVGPLLNNIGRLLTEMGDIDGAENALLEAREHCVAQDDQHHLILAELGRATLRLRSNRPNEALIACRKAAQLSNTLGDERWLAQIDLTSGAAYAQLNCPDLALSLLERAGTLARQRKDAKELADIVLEQAGVLRSLGRNRETLQCLNEAQRLFERLRARRDLHDVDSRLSELETSFLRIVTEWGESIENKDRYTRGHCIRVADFACRLATVYGLPEEELTWFRMGALLHDVGKIVVPLEILNKKGRLTDQEFRVMAAHPVAGVELMEGVEFPWDVRPMIRHHHERWDGTGYPDGLTREEIPVAARILTVADVYDALTTDRSYRPGFTHDKALDIMTSEAGRTLDPALFALFLKRVEPAIRPRSERKRVGWPSRKAASSRHRSRAELLMQPAPGL